MEEIDSDLAKRLRYAVKMKLAEMGRNQQWLASRIGIGHESLSRKLAGKQGSTTVFWAEVAKELNVTFEDLVRSAAGVDEATMSSRAFPLVRMAGQRAITPKFAEQWRLGTYANLLLRQTGHGQQWLSEAIGLEHHQGVSKRFTCRVHASKQFWEDVARALGTTYDALLEGAQGVVAPVDVASPSTIDAEKIIALLAMVLPSGIIIFGEASVYPIHRSAQWSDLFLGTIQGKDVYFYTNCQVDEDQLKRAEQIIEILDRT